MTVGLGVDFTRVVPVIAIVAVTPLVSGLLAGLTGKLIAKQSQKPELPVLQPFYVFAQLLRLDLDWAEKILSMVTLLQLAFSLLALGVLVLQRNILVAVFFQSMSVMIAMTAEMARPSQVVAAATNKQLKTFLAYQPILLSVVAGVGLATGGFLPDSVQDSTRPLVVELPFLWLALVYVTYLSGKLELNRLFAGPLLAMAQLAGCFRQATLLFIAATFWTQNLVGICVVAILLSCGLAAAEFLRVRLPRRLTAAWGWGYVYFACAINLSWVYIKYLL